MLTRSQRDRWAAALRSGAYEQARYAFRQPNKYCCLAVLCESVGHATSDGVDLGSIAYADLFTAAYRAVDALLSREGRDQFIQYNDTDELTFPQIAERVDALPVVEASHG